MNPSPRDKNDKGSGREVQIDKGVYIIKGAAPKAGTKLTHEQITADFRFLNRSGIRPYEQAVLTTDIPEKNLKAGDMGTVVEVYDEGAGYSLEFFTSTGETVAVATVTADSVQPFDKPIDGKDQLDQ